MELDCIENEKWNSLEQAMEEYATVNSKTIDNIVACLVG